jgi:hypothetical protein
MHPGRALAGWHTGLRHRETIRRGELEKREDRREGAGHAKRRDCPAVVISPFTALSKDVWAITKSKS